MMSGSINPFSSMTRRQNRYFNRFQMDGKLHAISSKSDLSASNISNSLDRLTSGREAIRWEAIGLLEDEAVQEVMRLKGIPLS